MIIKNSPEYQHFSVDTQKTQLKLLCISGDSGVINFCGGLYQKWDSYHPNQNYQPVLIFNRMQQTDRKREQLQKERAAICEISKAQHRKRAHYGHCEYGPNLTVNALTGKLCREPDLDLLCHFSPSLNFEESGGLE